MAEYKSVELSYDGADWELDWRTNMTRYEQLEKKKQLCFDAMLRVDNLEAQIIWSRHYRDLDTIQKSLTITDAERVVQC